MNTMEEHKPDANAPMVQQAKKYPIICKFWMMGNCIKEEKCDYLHTERDKNSFPNFSKGFNRSQSGAMECPMYKLGFCKNGSLCSYKHTKEEKPEADLEKMEVPLWYLEYFFGKPASLIFQDFEMNNKEETDQLKEKYFPNAKKIQKLPKLYAKNQKPFQFDIYAEKKDSIIRSLNQKVRYFFIRNKSMDYVQFAMENNIILNTKQNAVKFSEAQKSCDEVVFIIFDEEHMNFNGFCRFKKEIDEKEVTFIADNYMTSYNKALLQKHQNSMINNSFLKIEWHWKTKLSYNKVELLKNPLNDNEMFVASKDGQEVSIDLGYYVCRFMIKRLTKDEVQGYLDYKRKYEENKGLGLKTDDKEMTSLELLKPQNRSSNSVDINSLIYDEINKNGSGQSNPAGQSSTAGSSIIVTNISNLQVNISQNSYMYQDKARSYNNSRNSAHYYEKSDRRGREDSYDRRRKKSYRRDKSRSNSASRSRSRDRYRTERKRTRKEKRRNSKDELEKFDSDCTVVNKEPIEVITLSSDDSSKFLNHKRRSEELSELTDISTSKKPSLDEKIVPAINSAIVSNPAKNIFPDSKANPVMKNKLFSNAMEKIALNYTKKEPGKYSSNK